MDALKVSVLSRDPEIGPCPTAINGEALRYLICRKRSKRKNRHVETSIRDGKNDEVANAVATLGCFRIRPEHRVRRNVKRCETSSDDRAAAAGCKRRRCGDGESAIVPPYEYCSIAMMNQLRQGYRIDNVLTDKGGTVKNILQSSKSFVHYLVTYPLKNTFRGYIQISPYLLPKHIGLPFHHATRLFALDIERDRDILRFRPEGATCGAALCVNERLAPSRGARGASTFATICECEIWPDSKCSFYFETNRNFSLILKRDPCIHNGSVVGVDRVYVFERGEQSNDSIHVSSFVLKHLNADFDGDAVTVMIVRGIESSREANECLSDPMLFDSTPRFTFCQSLIFWTFRTLAFDDEVDETRANLAGRLDPRTAKTLLRSRLDLWKSAGARNRARRVFGQWYDSYERVLRKIWRYDAAWDEPIWRQHAVLDAVYVDAARESRPDELYARMLRNVLTRDYSIDFDPRFVSVLLDDDIFCLENWIMVHSGAKGTPRDLCSLRERYEDRSRETSVSRVSAHQDFFRECDAEREREYVQYLDDFIIVSKHVPKSSYFASGLKWVSQTCAIKNGDLFMSDSLLLRDIAYYLKNG